MTCTVYTPAFLKRRVSSHSQQALVPPSPSDEQLSSDERGADVAYYPNCVESF